MSSQLTRYPIGSIREIAHLALPMMISAFSTNAILLLNRAILAHFSLDAVNAASAVEMECLVIQFLFVGITCMGEVLAGQYYGQKEHHHVARPVWQMIWLALGASLLTIPLGLFGGNWLVPPEIRIEGLPYYRWMMSFSFLLPLITAVSSFFIAQGKTKLIFWTSLLANAIDLMCAFPLIFGVNGFLPALGAEGASIATVIAQSTQVLILFGIFLKASNRSLFHTHKWNFFKADFKTCIKIGLPNAANYFLEFGGWALVMWFMVKAGNDFLTIRTLSTTVFMLFGFLSNGVNKALIAIVSNLIGAREETKVPHVLKSTTIFAFSIVSVILLVLNLFPDKIAFLFTGQILSPALLREIQLTFWGISMFIVFDTLAWFMVSVLTSGGDTRFVMLMNGSAAWFIAVLPCILGMWYFDLSPHVIFLYIYPFYGLVNFLGLFLRYRTNKWVNRLTEPTLHPAG